MTTTARRRRQEKKLHREKEILKAALEVFAAYGFEAARIDDVAQRAGIAKGTIYLYFPDKERLFQAVVRNLIPKKFDAMVRALPGPPTDLVRGLLSQIYVNIVANDKVRVIVRMLVAESGRFPKLADIYYNEIIVPGMKAMRQALRLGVAAGTFRRTKAEEFPQIIVAPALVAMLWQILFDKSHRLDLDAYVNAHLDFVLRSLKLNPT